MLSGNKKEIFSRFQLYAQLRPWHDGQSENGKLLPGTERETGKKNNYIKIMKNSSKGLFTWRWGTPGR